MEGILATLCEKWFNTFQDIYKYTND